MKRYQAKLGDKRKQLHEQQALEKNRKKLDERKEHICDTSEDVEVEVEVVDVNPKNGSSMKAMNHESAAMSEGCESNSSDNDIFDKAGRALSLTDVDFLITKLRS